MKRYLKYILLFLICCFPVILIIYFAVPWNSYPSLSIAGSSSLQPLFMKFSEEWKSETDLVIQGGGSGFGIKSIATNSKDIGLSSKNTYDTVQKANINKNGYDKTTWDINKIKTLTIGWDSIVIVYKNKNELKLNVDDGSLLKLYDLFSGNKKYKVNDFISGTNNEYWIPYSRSGGASASGTTTSFMYESTFDWEGQKNNNSEIEKIELALKSGNYLNNNVRVTNESNVETWNKIKYENLNNSITYLSLSFVLQNYKDIYNSGFRVATFNNINPIEYLKKNALDANFLKEYKWFSPFNIMISLLENKNSIHIKEFISWIYTSNEAYKIFIEQGIVPVNGNNNNDSNYHLTNYLFSWMINNEVLTENGISKETYDITKHFNLIYDLKNADIQYGGIDNYYGISKRIVLESKLYKYEE